VIELSLQVVTWSTWLSTLLSVKDLEPINNKEVSDSVEEVQRQRKFSLLKATSELFMLPKDMIDMAMRREVSNFLCQFNSKAFH